MNAILTRTTMSLGIALAMTCAALAFGDEPAATAKAKLYKGTIIEVGQNTRNVTVRGLVTTRNFNAGDDCVVAFEDKKNAAWSDLAVGQKVEVCYYSAHGVKVARRIDQQNRVLKGYVTALDATKRTIAVRHAGFTKDFALAQDATVAVNGKSGSLGDLKIGDTVSVIYRTENTPLMAQRIEQNNRTFAGTIRAVDARAETVTLKGFMQEKRFHLADDCKIVVNDKLGGSLSDLRIGDRLSVSYENADGVLVANRIGRENVPVESFNPTAASEYSP